MLPRRDHQPGKGCEMRNQVVRDVMRANPVAVTTTTTYKELAAIVVGQRISALPVLSRQGKLVGLVCEADLLAKEELHKIPGTGHPGLPHGRSLRAKAYAATAGEVMRAHPVTIGPDVTVSGAARVMDRHHLTCLPV